MRTTRIASAVGAAILVSCPLWQPAQADERPPLQAQMQASATESYTLDNAQPPAQGAQSQAQAPAPTQQAQAPAAASSTDAQDWSRWQIRLRALGVITATSASTAYVQGVPSLSSPNSGLSVGNSVVPELDITYYLTRNISLELILGMSQNHITGNGALNGLDVGSTWMLPPTLTLQYHFLDFGRFQPYIGAGVNYTFFFNQQPAGTYTPSGLAVTGLNINNSAGFAAQVGFDYMIDKHWGINFDVKKLILRPNYTGWVNYTIPVSGTAALDPWLIGAGITYRF